MIRSSVALRLVVLALAVAVMGIGLVSAREAPVDALPEFKSPYVEVQTEALGLSAIEVEQLVTAPLEADLLNGVAFLDEIRSESVAGLSSIQMFFEPGTDVFQARQLVQEKLTEARALPNVSKAPAMLQPLSSAGRVMMVSLRSDELSLIEMSVLARWKIKPRLMGVPGVANVAIFGQRERQLQVQVDPERLRRNGVSLNQVISTTANALWSSPLSFVEASTPGSGGFIDTPQQRLGIQHVLPITTPEHLAQVAVEDVTGRRLSIGDIAVVAEDHQPLIGDAIVADEPGLMLVIEKFPRSNTREVTQELEAALQALTPGLPGLEIDTTVYRPADFIDGALDNIGRATLLAGLLVVLALGFLLLPWRVALLSVTAMILSLTAAVAVLSLRDATFDAMVLAGLVIAIGVVVDDAIVTSEHLARRIWQRHRGNGKASSAPLVVDAALEIRRPLLPASLMLIVIAVPVYLVGGLDGALLRPAVEAYVVALLAALLVAVTVTPALALILLVGASHQREPLLARWLQRGFRPVLAAIMPRAAWVWVGVVAALALSLALVPNLSADRTAPGLKDRDLLVRWDTAPGTSLPEMTRTTAEATRALRQIEGIRGVGAHVGRAITSDQVIGVNAGEIWISLRRDADYDATLAAVGRTLADYPAFNHDLLAYSDKRIEELSPETDEPVVVRVYGEDLRQLEAKAGDVRRAIAEVEGIVAPRIVGSPTEPTVEVEVNLARAQQFGIKPGDVRRASATLLSGVQVGNLFETQKVFDVMVVGAPQARSDLDSIRDLLIDTPGGGHARLGQVAEVRLSSAPVVIRHDAVSRYVDVVADVRGRDVGSVVQDVEARLGSLDFPLEYHAEVLGDFAERRADNLQVLAAGVAAALALLLLLQAATGSWRIAGMLLVTLPVALVGAMAAVWLLPGVPAWTTLLGLGTVTGIAVRHAVVLVAAFQSRALARGGATEPSDVRLVAEERLVPATASTLATALALLPVAVMGADQGLEVLYPIAIVVLAGLVTTSIYTSLVVPTLYLRHAPRESPDTDVSMWGVSLPRQVDLTQQAAKTGSTADAGR